EIQKKHMHGERNAAFETDITDPHRYLTRLKQTLGLVLRPLRTHRALWTSANMTIRKRRMIYNRNCQTLHV
ncbi:hypothetical protein M9458_029221, partial [Cirrhinus mrigala]